MKKNVTRTSILLLFILTITSLFSSVLARDVNIIPEKGLDKEIYIVLYENPHPMTIRRYFSTGGKDAYGFLPLGCGCNVTSYPASGTYETWRVMLTNEPTSNYVGTASDKSNQYRYMIYNTQTASTEIANGWNFSRTNHDGYRPVSKSKYDLDKYANKVPDPGENNPNYLTVNGCYHGIGEYQYKVLCQKNCNGKHSGSNVSATGHIYVSKNKISKSVLDKIANHNIYKTAPSVGGKKYIYMSDAKRINSSYNLFKRNTTLYTAAQFIDAIVNSKGTVVDWDVTNVKDYESAVINTYDNKLHIADVLNKKLVVRYFDVSGNKQRLIEVDRVDNPTRKVSKSDGTPFSKDDLGAMNYSTEEINVNSSDNGAYKIKIPEDSVFYGYNIGVGSQIDYNNSSKINISHTSSLNYPGNSEGKDIYLDVFVNSKKRVYVRHRSASKYYDINKDILSGLTPSIVTGLPKLAKRQPSAELVNKDDMVENSNFAGVRTAEYEEKFVIPIKSYLSIINRIESGDASKSSIYIGNKMASSSVASDAKNKLNGNYTGGIIKLPERGNTILTSKGDETTYVDMFYSEDAINDTPIVEKPKPAKNTWDAAGVLYFQSDDPQFSAKTANETSPNLVDDSIPSGESLFAGILEVYPYIFPRADLEKHQYTDSVSNGRHTTRFNVIEYRIANASVFTIKDTILKDTNSQQGGKLFDTSDTVRLPLSNEYTSTKNTTTYSKGNYENSTSWVSTHSECGGICEDLYFTIKMNGDKITHNGQDLIPDTKTTIVSKQLIASRRCKSYKVLVPNDDPTTGSHYETKYKEDITKRKYYSPSVPSVVQIPNYESTVKGSLYSSKKPAKITKDQMHNLYANNQYSIPLMRFNGKRVPSATLTYELSYLKGEQLDSVNVLEMSTANKDVEPVIIHTPVIADMTLESNTDSVNHSNVTSGADGDIIQKNTPFKVNMVTSGTGKHAIYPAIPEFIKYTKEHYIKFLFDLQYIKVYNLDGSENNGLSINRLIPAGEWVKVPAGGSVYAQAVYRPDDTQEEIVTSLISKYQIKSVAINAPTEGDYINMMLTQDGNAIGGYSEDKANRTLTNASVHKNFHPEITLEKEARYSARAEKKTKNIGRIYDFKISDVVDIDWKYVFRKVDGIDHSGRVYFVGSKKWNMYSSQSNELVERGSAEIGTNPQRVLPVGPYKHSNSGYYSAPKLGYTFSFDLKTTGGIDIEAVGEGASKVNKKIEVKPSFYFVGKDGTRYEKNIDLYYKNTVGKYVKLGSSADTASISMRPEDGSRYISQYEPIFNERYLSKDLISIGKYNSVLTLKAGTNMATNNKRFVQLWYGAYKLPNSTIAVKKGKTDLNNALKDGYIGVKFDITCVENLGSTEYRISYGNQDTSKPGTQNTSQWDYEGFLGCIPGSSFNGSLRLEKGTWNINNQLYQEIKGTIMLYDADARAAEDFDAGAAK